MTIYYKQCKNCYQSFKATRNEAVFCTPRCTAAYARSEGYERTRIHEEKEEENGQDCAHCGKRFFYNDYAERGGQRKAQYCSNRCRTAAYRARKKENAGYTGNWDDARNDKTKTRSGKSESSKGTEKERQNYEDTQREQQQRAKARAEQTYKHTSQTPPNSKHTSQARRWKSNDPYVILGVTYVSTKAEIRSAWAKLAKEWHPDTCKHPDAVSIMSAINGAYEKLTKGYSRTRR